MYQFTNECYTGIDLIDLEHRHFFELVNGVFALLAESNDVSDATKDLIKDLKDYAQNHFAHEEAYMASIHDPELTIQKMEHVIFLKRLESIELDSDIQKRDLENILKYLVQWFYRHIMSSDMMIGHFKSNKGIESVRKTHFNSVDTSPYEVALAVNQAQMDTVKAANETNYEFDFTDEYLTGIDFIDEEHKKLFEIIGETQTLVRDDMIPDKYDHIMMILEELKSYTRQHFDDEEAYMEQIHYEQLPAQKKAHHAFIEKLVQLDFEEMDYIDDHQQAYLEELVTYLLDWLINHIMKMDKLIPHKDQV